MSDVLRSEIDRRGVARLVLARPEKHNALSADLIDALADAAVRLGLDPAVRVVVLEAEGASFCAGGDLGWMRAQMNAGRPERLDAARRLAHMLRALDELEKPLIGRVQGPAYGGGLGLIAVCDRVVAADTAVFGLTETRLGLIPATIGPYVIARVGAGQARGMFFSGAVFDAGEARRLGLVADVVPAADLDRATAAAVEPYLSTAPGAVAAAKRLARSLGPVIDDRIIEATIGALADVWEGEEARAGIAAFFAREKPPWARG
jgi:methylglutaconyl-CoA hydratase